jgi:hypothetical protein
MCKRSVVAYFEECLILSSRGDEAVDVGDQGCNAAWTPRYIHLVEHNASIFMEFQSLLLFVFCRLLLG